MLDLRTALRLDAVASGSLGVGLVALSALLDGPLGLPMPLSMAVGGLLLAWAGFVAWASGRPNAAVGKEIVALNLGYVAQAAAVVGLVAMQAVAIFHPNGSCKVRPV